MLQIIRSIVLGKNINDPLLLHNHHHRRHHHPPHRWRHHFLLFVPIGQVVSNTLELAQLARQVGMDVTPDATLTSIIFSWPASPPPLSTHGASLPFPSLSSASLVALRRFEDLSGGIFQVIFCHHDYGTKQIVHAGDQYPSSPSLYSSHTGARIDDMAGLCRALVGGGWSLFQTGSGRSASCSGYVFRKVDTGTISENVRVKEMRLPELDFGKNMPLKILYYIILMTDNIFYVA